MSRKAYVTLLTAPGYLPGVLVLHECLVSVGSRFPLVVMATPSLSVEACLRSKRLVASDTPENGEVSEMTQSL